MRVAFFIIAVLTALGVRASDEDELCRLFNICPNGPVIDGVSYLDHSQCTQLLEVYPYTSSPFVSGVCQRYHGIKQKTSLHERVFLVKKRSELASVYNNYYAQVYLDNNPRFEFYIDYGVANELEVSELSRIYQQHQLTNTKPYNGEALQVLSVDMLAEFETISVDDRHAAINFDTSSGVEFFDSIEVLPFPEQGYAYVSIALTPLGQSVISQSLMLDIPLYGLFSWRANHTFGPLTVAVSGDLGCIKELEWGAAARIVPCTNG